MPIIGDIAGFDIPKKWFKYSTNHPSKASKVYPELMYPVAQAFRFWTFHASAWFIIFPIEMPKSSKTAINGYPAMKAPKKPCHMVCFIPFPVYILVKKSRFLLISRMLSLKHIFLNDYPHISGIPFYYQYYICICICTNLYIYIHTCIYIYVCIPKICYHC